MKARAAVLVKPQNPFEIAEYLLEKPMEGYALVKILASGICGTDVHIYNGKLPMPTYPIIIGHEMIGEVVEVSPEGLDGRTLAAGQRVIVNVAVPCGKCCLCNLGEDANCINLNATYAYPPEKKPHLFGGFAEYAYVPVDNMVEMPENVPVLTAAVFACAGPTSIHAFKLAKNIDFKKINTAIVQGLGPVGIFSAIYLKAKGVENIVAITRGKNEKRAEIASQLGVNHFLNTSESTREERLSKVMEISGGVGADCVIEASGNPEAFVEGVELLRNRGVYIVQGQYSNSGEIPFKPQIITFKALEIIGSSQYTIQDQKDYIDFMESNPQIWDLVESVCTHRWKLEQINEAIDCAIKGEAIKSIILM